MINDIVVRLRNCDCIPQCLCGEAAKEIERLREERDGARAEVCLLRSARTEVGDVVDQTMADYAISRGWDDLFKEVIDGR